MIAFTSSAKGEARTCTPSTVAYPAGPLAHRPGRFLPGASYSPDGSRLLFSASQTQHGRVRRPGRRPRRAPDHGSARDHISAILEPRRQARRLVSEAGGTPQIYTMAADGSDVRRITFQGTTTRSRLEPEGRSDRVLRPGRAPGFDLYTVAVDTGKVTRLTQNQGTNEKPAWAPNGR